MYILKKWSLKESFDGSIYANGTVFGHHRLVDGEYIHTSEIEKVYICDGQGYIVETHSGSLYQLLTEEMNTELTEETKEKLSQFKILDGAAMKEKLDEVEEALEKKQRLVGEAENTAKDNMDEDGLYLIMEYMHVVKAILKKDAVFREIHASVHVGMFQDSVLITDWMEGEVDFRYFPNHMMEPYQWSDGLNCIYIHNIGNSSIVFKGTRQKIECKASEVTKIKKDEYRGEGLFSPDAVNGKCVLCNAHDSGDESHNENTITQDEINKLLGGE